jgi:hypothetical protein
MDDQLFSATGVVEAKRQDSRRQCCNPERVLRPSNAINWGNFTLHNLQQFYYALRR